MGRKYEIHGSDTNTDNTTILYLANETSAPKGRLRIFEYKLGSRATPAENACGYEFQRFTAENATPGGTAVTPSALDPADPAALANAVSAPTGEPTYTANSFVDYVALNMRATFRWVANPGCEFVIPATGDNGIGIVADTPTTAFAEFATIHFEE